MILTDDNTAEYKKYYNIPDDFSCYREYYHFGTCPSFRKYWNDDKGKWFCDLNIEKSIFIHDGRRFDGWEDLRLYLADCWRPQSADGQAWYLANIAA